MPLPLVHLAIAVDLATHYPLAGEAAFLLGSLAPDAIHMRPNTTRSDKNRTHLLTTNHSETPDTDYAAALDQFFVPAWQQADPFLQGYAAHLLADRRWVQTIMPHFRAVRPPELSNADGVKLYYHEVDQIDLMLYRQMPWRTEIWERLATATAQPVADLLTAAEVAGWQQRTFAWFAEREHTAEIQPRYITYERVSEFIHEAATTIAEQFATWGEVAKKS